MSVSPVFEKKRLGGGDGDDDDMHGDDEQHASDDDGGHCVMLSSVVFSGRRQRIRVIKGCGLYCVAHWTSRSESAMEANSDKTLNLVLAALRLQKVHSSAARASRR